MAEPAEKKSEVPAGKPAARKETRQVSVLRVSGPERGRWRAGHLFGAAPVDLPIDELTDEEVAAIQADPQLVSVIETLSEEIEVGDA